MKKDYDIEGVWLEKIAGDVERPYSIGIVTYDDRQKRYRFDGANYKSNGEPFCVWRTPIMNFDTANMELAYIFKASVIGEMNQEHTGFGMLNLKILKEGTYTFKDGYYQEATINSQPLSHSMERIALSDTPYDVMPDNPSKYADYIVTLTKNAQ